MTYFGVAESLCKPSLPHGAYYLVQHKLESRHIAKMGVESSDKVGVSLGDSRHVADVTNTMMRR
jgi:hypothetical protein